MHTEEREVRKEAGKPWPAAGPSGTGAQKGYGTLLSTMAPEAHWITPSVSLGRFQNLW